MPAMAAILHKIHLRQAGLALLSLTARSLRDGLCVVELAWQAMRPGS